MTGEKLNDYMRKNIFEALGIKNMSMIPTQEMKSKMAYMNHRENDGTLRPRDHLARLPVAVSSKEEAERTFNSGGGGMFAQPREYCSKHGTCTPGQTFHETGDDTRLDGGRDVSNARLYTFALMPLQKS